MPCVLGRYVNTQASLRQKNQMLFIAAIWLPDKKDCRWHSTFLRIEDMMPTTSGLWVMSGKPAYRYAVSKIWKFFSTVFLWIKCRYPWPWTALCYLSWRFTSTQDWNKEPNSKKWPELSKTIFWKSLWCVIPTSTHRISRCVSLPIYSNSPLNTCPNSIRFPSRVTTCRKPEQRPILNWHIRWPTDWNIFVQASMQAWILTHLRPGCRSSGLSVWIISWKSPKCGLRVCCGQKSSNSSIPRIPNLWLCVRTHKLRAGLWPNKTRSITWDVHVSKPWGQHKDTRNLCTPTHLMKQSPYRPIFRRVSPEIPRYIFRKKPM